MADVEELFSRLRSTPFVEQVNAVPQEIGNRGGITPSGWLADNSVSADVIQANAVVAGKIDANAVTANEIAAGSITTAKLAANAVTAAKIQANTITANEIAANTLTANEIAANAITANELSANSVETNHIVAANVTSAKIVATITGKKYGSDDGAAGAPGFFFDAASNYGLYRNATTPTMVVAGGQSFAFGGIVNESVELFPDTDNVFALGASTNRWTEVWAVDGSINTSDARLKTDVVDSPLGLAFVNRLRPVAYRWKETRDTQSRRSIDNEAIARESAPHEQRLREIRAAQMRGEIEESAGDRLAEDERVAIRLIHAAHIDEARRSARKRRPGRRTHYGLIAQEVKQALDEEGLDAAFWKDADGVQALAYSELIAPLIKAVQELAARVEALEA